MEINRLNQEELAYELTIRGLQVGKVDEMRVQLRAARQAEKTGQILVVDPYPISYEEDIQALTKKLAEINELVNAFVGDIHSSDYKKVVTKVEWALARLCRCVGSEDEQVKEKKRIRTELILVLGSLQTKAEGVDEFEDSDSSSISEAPSIATARPKSPRSVVPVYKWGIQFSGEQGQSLNSFLERVIEVSEARGASKTQLFRSALDLFTGRALIWYRANKSQFHTWSDLVRELRKEFLPADYDERLLDEIRRRTQGKEETIGTYVAIMTTMFNRLNEDLSEVQKLRILKRNVSPFYQTQLSLTQVDTISELVELGRRLETVRASVEAFVPPPSRKSAHLLESDLAYVASRQPSVSVISSNNPNRQMRPQCYQCGREGHIARYCPRNRRCYGCGRQGVIRPQCPNCRNGQRCMSDQNGAEANVRSQDTEERGNESRARR